MSVLHVLDATTPPDAIEILAQVLPLREHRVVALGPQSTVAMARAAGIAGPIPLLHSMGWADPTGWRALRRVIADYAPTHVHSWGIPAAIATAISRYKGRRVVSLVDLPKFRHLQLLSFIHKGGLTVSVSPCQWIVSTSWLKRELHGHSIPADAVTLLRPALRPIAPTWNGSTREELGIMPEDGPILLLGGDGGAGTMLTRPGVDPLLQGGRGGPRHDLGLWAAGILQLIFPRIRAIVREDPRRRHNAGLARLHDKLLNNDVTVLAPAEWPWQRLLSIADALVVTPDGPFASGSIVHANAARVPVIGTPVDSVREHVTDRQTGLLAPSTKVREISAVIESYLADPSLRERLSEQAYREAETRHDPAAMLRGYDASYS